MPKTSQGGVGNMWGVDDAGIPKDVGVTDGGAVKVDIQDTSIAVEGTFQAGVPDTPNMQDVVLGDVGVWTLITLPAGTKQWEVRAKTFATGNDFYVGYGPDGTAAPAAYQKIPFYGSKFEETDPGVIKLSPVDTNGITLEVENWS